MNQIDQANLKRLPRTQVNFSKKEFETIQEESEITGRSLPDILKETYFKGPRVQPLFARDGQDMILTELRRQGNNLNQIARALNTGIAEGWYPVVEKCLSTYHRLLLEVQRN